MKYPIAFVSVAACALLGLAPQARADIVVVAPTASTNGSFTITNPITFTITTAGNAQFFALDEWVTSDGSLNFSSFFPDLFISINGGAPMQAGAGSFADNASQIIGQITADDGFFTADPFAVAVGVTVTLLPNAYNLGPSSGFNLQANQTFSGNMFITDSGGALLSNVVSAAAVPEPATWISLLGGVAILGAVQFRRCRNA